MSRSTVSLFAAHLIGNALLLWLGYYWLGIGESDGAHLAWSIVVIVAFTCCGVWLHGTSLALFSRETQSSFGRAARAALRHLVPLLVIVITAALLYALLAYWHNSFGHKAFVIGSYTTMKLRKPVPPSRVLQAFHVLIWLLRWLVVPAILLPLAADVAIHGWRGFQFRSLRHSRRILYWPAVCALLVCAIWVPLKLVAWVPEISKFTLQMASFLGRIGVGYLLFVAALLALEFLTSAGKPRLSQPSTASSP